MLISTLKKVIARLLNFPEGYYRTLEGMKGQIDELGGSLTFKIVFNQDGWMARCQEIPALFTGGSQPVTEEKLNREIKDVIFSAFNVPVYYIDYSVLQSTREIIRELNKRNEQTEKFFFGALWQTNG